MSKIGKINISIPEKVNVALNGSVLNVDGPLGKKTLNIDTNLFDGVQNLSGDDTFQYCISVSGSNFTIMAKNPKTNCQITLNQNLVVNRNSSC